MLHDRHYMREPDFRTGKPIWSILIVINVVVFLLQMVIGHYGKGEFLVDYAYLSPTGISKGYIWQLLTFQFLHGSPLHLILNMFFGIWMFGRTVEDRLGRSAFLKLYLLSGFAGGLLQVVLGFIFPNQFGGATVGASAGTAGLFAAFCLFEPYAEIRLMMIFPIRAIHLLYAQIAIALIYTILPDKGGNIANAAHLGGILFAIAFMRSNIFSKMPSLDFLKSLRRQPRKQYVSTAPAKAVARKKPQPAGPKDLPPEEFITQEVDPILDKISSQGIHSLTDRERQILEAARKKMSKK